MNKEKQDESIRLLFENGVKTGQKVFDAISVPLDLDKKQDGTKLIVLFFFTKTYKTYQAIFHLWLGGFILEAYMLCRTIFELSMQTRYLMNNPVSRTDRYCEHELCVWYDAFQHFSKTNLAKELSRRKHDLLEWKNAKEKFKGKYEPPNMTSWWGEDIDDLAAKLDKESNEKSNANRWSHKYHLSYKQQTHFIHSTPYCIEWYIDSDDENVRPKEDCLFPLLWFLFDCIEPFLCVLSHANEVFELGYEEDIHCFAEEYKNVLNILAEDQEKASS